MAVYLNASSAEFAKNCGKMTALQLGQSTELPYFKAFAQQYLTLDELYQLLDKHIQQCCLQAGWNSENLANVPIFLGSTGYVLTDCEARLANHQPLPTEYSIAVIGEHLRQRYQTEVFSLATSCTSSAQGIYYAYQALQTGLAEKALVIGFETFNRLTFEHFHAMHLLAENENSLPFIAPKGMILGEGVGCLALSKVKSQNFGCELTAMTNLTDCENLTNNSLELFERLIQQILAQGNISAQQSAGVKAHAVGGNFDTTEHEFLATHFTHSTWFMPKAYIGHTLGASGVTETAFLVDCLQQGKFPDLQKNAQNQPLFYEKMLPNGYYLNYFLGFGSSNVGWLMKWEQ